VITLVYGPHRCVQCGARLPVGQETYCDSCYCKEVLGMSAEEMAARATYLYTASRPHNVDAGCPYCGHTPCSGMHQDCLSVRPAEIQPVGR
jgi:hypothetical protein